MTNSSIIKKKISLFLLSFIALFLIHNTLFIRPAYAHCPLCVAGAGVGLSLSRYLGIDDSITGIWMAAFLGAMSLWLTNSLKKKYVPLQSTVIYVATFVLTIISFYRFGLVNEHNGLLLNLPKLIFGMLVGGIIFYLVDIISGFIKRKRGSVLFPYQGVVFSLGSMILTSAAIFILINYYI